MTKLRTVDPEALAREIRAEKLRRDLYDFARAAWQQVEPAMPYRDNWHVRVLCRRLERVARGECRKLLITVPPGTAKSLITSVIFPAWIWTWRPAHRMISSSYAEMLSTRDAVRTRTLVESKWYQEHFVRGRWRLSDDMNRKDMFTNSRTGLRLSLSVGSKASGFRGNLVQADDPINVKDAPSKAARDEVIYWWDKVMPSRVHDPERDAFVVIMQRVHEDDLAGHLIRQGGYEHLCLPAEFDPDHPHRSHDDPRTERGELLFPGLLTKAALDDFRLRLGSDGYAGQYQQVPTAAEGGAFKYAWWRFFRPKKGAGDAPRPRLCYQGDAVEEPNFPLVVASVDASFKDSDGSDYVAVGIWGARGAERYLLDMVRKRLDFPGTLREIERLHAKWPQCRRWLVEDKANGSAIIAVLRSKIPGIVAVQPEGGKEARAAAAAPQVEAYQVYLPEGAAWVQDYVDELAAFPRGRHDDMVDVTSQALIHLSRADVLRAVAMVSNI